MSGSDTTAILIFTRTASAEAAAKPLAGRGGRNANQQIVNALIQHTRREAEKAGLPVFTCFHTEQVGDHFGERLTHAMQTVFDKGFSRD